MKRMFLIAILAAGTASAEGRWHRVYKWSAAAMVAGSALDAASSWGRPEANPVLAGGRAQRFGGRGLAIKAGSVVGVLLVQRLLRQAGADPKPLAITNFVAGAVFTGAAAYNWRLAAAVPQQRGAVITPGATSFSCAGCSNPWGWK